MEKYNLKHKISTHSHPETCGKVEVSNKQLKQILEKTISTSRKDLSKKLGDALQAYMTALKTHLGLLPYKFYEKACLLSDEMEHKAYWEIKFLKFDEKTAERKRLLNLDKLEEIRLRAYDNAVIYKERTKGIMLNFGEKGFSNRT